MKRFKILSLFALFLLMISCETRNVEIESTDALIEGRPVKTYVIDGCEYLGFQWDRSMAFSHKGNCKNPIHCKNDTTKN